MLKFFHPPHLFVWPHYLAKQTLLPILLLSGKWTRRLQSQRHGVGRSISILEQKWTAHTTAVSSSKRVCCLRSEQYVVITGRHCSRMERQRTPHGPRWTIWKKEHVNFIEPHMWPPNSPDINPVDYSIWDALQQWVYHQRQFKTVEELKRVIVTQWQKLSQRFIDNSRLSMNGVDVLKLFSRMAADTSSIATWLEQPHIILIL